MKDVRYFVFVFTGEDRSRCFPVPGIRSAGESWWFVDGVGISGEISSWDCTRSAVRWTLVSVPYAPCRYQ